MRLVGETALGSDLAQGLVGRKHEALRPLHSASDNVLVRGVTDALAECNVEVELAETGNCSEVLISDRTLQIGVDVRENPSDLPWREASAHSGGRGNRLLFHRLKKGFRAQQAFRSLAALVAESLIQGGEDLGDNGMQSMQAKRIPCVVDAQSRHRCVCGAPRLI